MHNFATNMKKVLFIFILFLTFESVAQLSMKWVFETKKDSLFFNKMLSPLPDNVADSLTASSLLRGVIMELHQQSYLEAALDFITQKDSILWVKPHLGNPYKWAFLKNGNVPDAFLSQIGYREKLYENKRFIYSEIANIEEKLLSYAEDNGYPFAQVWLDSIAVENGQISASLMMKTGDVFRFDTINTEGFAHISPKFLQKYLEITKGSLFSRSKVLRISQRLAELPYLKERKKATLSFREDNSVVIKLLLDERKASRWDFLVGVQPSTATDGSQKFNITFNGNLDFHNLLGVGERIMANFENLRPQSPRLNVKLTYPYILNAPFGFDGAFDLYKRDSTYIETYLNVGTQYLLGGNNYLKVFWNRYNARNLIINSAQIIANKRLPATLDIATNTYGLEFLKQKLDYRFNPRRGFSLLLRGGAGIRQVQHNSDILNLKDVSDTTFNFKSLYDTVTLKSFQYKIDIKTDFYIPIFNRSALKLGIQGGMIATSSPIAQNEQYRIGGNRLLRGFNEESIFATRYAIGTLEYRLLIGQNSYLYAFGDMGWVHNLTRTTNVSDTPLGFGMGITFETKVGMFGFTLAAGKEQGNAVDLRNVKTHFGYISLF